MDGPEISVVLPVYNQAEHVAAIVGHYEQTLGRMPYSHETLLVVNGCRDDSLGVCRGLAGRFPAVRVVHSDRGGWGLAVKLGLREARGKLLCYTNSARTSPEELALALLYAVTVPGTVVKANRKIREGMKRRLGSLLYNIECRCLFDLYVWDVNGTPKVFPRSCAELLKLHSDDDLIDAEFNLVCRREGYRLLEAPIYSSRRHGGVSTTTLKSAFRMYWGAYRLWRANRKAA